MLGREQILSMTPKVIKAPGLGGDVYVRSMTAGERESYEAALQDDKKAGRRLVRVRTFIASVCDEAGNLIFTDADLDAIKALDWQALDPAFMPIMRLNGLGEDAIEDAEKN